MSRKLDVITLENLHAGIMDVKNCVNDILQKLNMFQQRVHTLEMENSNLKHENKKLQCFLDQEYHKTDELDQDGRKENIRIYGIPEDFASEEDDGERKLLEIAANLMFPLMQHTICNEFTDQERSLKRQKLTQEALLHDLFPTKKIRIH